ncbi:MAG: hypothetical protein J6B85_00660 [Lachnospiraceae bacterium]|nr:hypothetical protein [Lachnospiraceae bacterium]
MMNLLIVPLVLTAAIECLIGGVLFRNRRTIYGIFLCNLLTNPVMNVLLYFITKELGWVGYLLGFPVLELLVVIVEAVVLRYLLDFPGWKAALVSFGLNAVTCAVTLVRIM